MKRRWILSSLLAVTLVAAAPAWAAEGEQVGLFGGPLEGMITALTTLIIFIVLVIILGKYAWGPISSGLIATASP